MLKKVLCHVFIRVRLTRGALVVHVRAHIFPVDADKIVCLTQLGNDPGLASVAPTAIKDTDDIHVWLRGAVSQESLKLETLTRVAKSFDLITMNYGVAFVE